MADSSCFGAIGAGAGTLRGARVTQTDVGGVVKVEAKPLIIIKGGSKAPHHHQGWKQSPSSSRVKAEPPQGSRHRPRI
jgi:hypothetical protein